MQLALSAARSCTRRISKHRNLLSGDLAIAERFAGAVVATIRAEEDGAAVQSPAALVETAIAKQDASRAAPSKAGASSCVITERQTLERFTIFYQMMI